MPDPRFSPIRDIASPEMLSDAAAVLRGHARRLRDAVSKPGQFDRNQIVRSDDLDRLAEWLDHQATTP